MADTEIRLLVGRPNLRHVGCLTCHAGAEPIRQHWSSIVVALVSIPKTLPGAPTTGKLGREDHFEGEPADD